jgi:uncharacterized protein (AIM24 family)
LSSIGDVTVESDYDCNCLSSLFGAFGITRNSLIGTGTTFLQGGGTVCSTSLKQGEQVIVKGSSLIGYQESVKHSVVLVGGLENIFCAGEGCCLNTVTGPGNYFLLLLF